MDLNGADLPPLGFACRQSEASHPISDGHPADQAACCGGFWDPIVIHPQFYQTWVVYTLSKIGGLLLDWIYHMT